ncbi:MAG TPA: dihydroorotate dehydrogenase-like protein [Ignavibacteria bacterium]|nr:dihydroorotate dehydrogenase-like protein [Ignavibacteria bacterium]
MDLSTKYMGLKLKNPLVPSASPLSKSVDMVKRLEESGASAVVVYSLFEEQITHEAGELDHYMSYGSESFAEALNYFPEAKEFNLGPDEYLRHLNNLKSAVDIPVIGSLNGVSAGGWLKYAKLIEEAGADALELNVYYIPANIEKDGTVIEEIYVRDLIKIKKNLKIPVAMKLSPYFSSMPNMAKKLDDAGADALVLFNRFYQPDIDLADLEVVPNLELSSSFEMRLPLRWIAILYGRIKANLAASTGIHTHEDVIKMLMAGADITCLCSELLGNGINRISEILKDLEKWMVEREYESVEQMKGSMSQKSVADPAAFERANYMKALNNYKLLI